jgi:hypothetical protein
MVDVSIILTVCRESFRNQYILYIGIYLNGLSTR